MSETPTTNPEQKEESMEEYIRREKEVLVPASYTEGFLKLDYVYDEEPKILSDAFHGSGKLPSMDRRRSFESKYPYWLTMRPGDYIIFKWKEDSFVWYKTFSGDLARFKVPPQMTQETRITGLENLGFSMVPADKLAQAEVELTTLNVIYREVQEINEIRKQRAEGVSGMMQKRIDFDL